MQTAGTECSRRTTTIDQATPPHPTSVPVYSLRSSHWHDSRTLDHETTAHFVWLGTARTADEGMDGPSGSDGTAADLRSAEKDIKQVPTDYRARALELHLSGGDSDVHGRAAKDYAS
ncbi:hypothetical protein BESB_024480 [Besnoitia besnoiti]|uniref:Uncharacterized protein n=1 Tax=Besnoitia besnoiti TaxID=94643 RepID=A0A2A9M7S8_BESBE|nr:hypothetical protein BESB_024480 [Besnoitia besnoiti]PFH31956.1 hypothetical protein BESB_024480 [Besnoitia besnoiti]